MNRDTRTFLVGIALMYAGSILLRALAATKTAFDMPNYTPWHWLFLIVGLIQIFIGFRMIVKTIDL